MGDPLPQGESSEPNDAELVDRLRSGDERAFDRLYLRHSRYLAGTLYRIMGDDHELDDIVQETFLVALDRIHDLRDRERVRSWLARIAVRMATRRLTTRGRRQRVRQRAAVEAPTSSDPAVRSAADDLYEALDRLPAKIRVPWILHRIEGESLPDTADACDVSLSTVKRRIASAQHKLEVLLDGDR